MKLRYCIVLLAVCLAPALLRAQDLVLQDYSSSGNQYLNTLVYQDTGSAAFKAGTRVYVLKKDGIYLLNGNLATVSGSKLSFRAEYGGTGHFKPTVYLFPTANGNPPPNFATLTGGSLTLKNIMITGYYEPVDSNLDRQQGALILVNTSGTGASVYVDSCILKSVNGNAIRTDGKPSTVRVTNTIFGDLGFIGNSNFGAGKAIDLRDQDVDTCDIQNCTFVNLQDRVVRHYQSNKGPIRNFIFNHNTVVNSLSYHGFLSLGRVDSTGGGILQIKNNLLVDHFALGADTAFLRQGEFGDPGELDPVNGRPRMAWVLTNPNSAAKWDISNNYYAISDSGQAMLNMTAPYAPYYKNLGPALTWGINKKLAADGKDTNATFKQVSVKLAKTPPLMTKMIRWIYRPRTEGGAGKEKNSGDANFTKIAAGNWAYDYNRRLIEYYSDTLNCRISASAATVAQLVSSDGKTIGDPRWGSPLTSVQISDAVPGSFALEQNYPNPFNPSTTIKYQVPVNGLVTLKVYNLVGQEVATLVNEVQTASGYETTFDASALSSGLYFYTLRSGNNVQTKKMMLLK